MQDFKNVSSSPVDVGGRVLAVAEIATLSPHNHAVHEAVTAGSLLAVTSEPEKPAKATRRGSNQTTEES